MKLLRVLYNNLRPGTYEYKLLTHFMYPASKGKGVSLTFKELYIWLQAKGRYKIDPAELDKALTKAGFTSVYERNFQRKRRIIYRVHIRENRLK